MFFAAKRGVLAFFGGFGRDFALFRGGAALKKLKFLLDFYRKLCGKATGAVTF